MGHFCPGRRTPITAGVPRVGQTRVPASRRAPHRGSADAHAGRLSRDRNDPVAQRTPSAGEGPRPRFVRGVSAGCLWTAGR